MPTCPFVRIAHRLFTLYTRRLFASRLPDVQPSSMQRLSVVSFQPDFLRTLGDRSPSVDHHGVHPLSSGASSSSAAEGEYRFFGREQRGQISVSHGVAASARDQREATVLRYRTAVGLMTTDALDNSSSAHRAARSSPVRSTSPFPDPAFRFFSLVGACRHSQGPVYRAPYYGLLNRIRHQ